MTNKFSCFLTQKGRWLTATLFLLFSLGVGNVWGTDPTPGEANSAYLDISKYSTITTAGWSVSNLTNMYAYDSSKGILRVSVYGSVSASGTQKWVSGSIGNTSRTWSATGNFAGSAAYMTSSSKCAQLASSKNATYLITNCTKVEALYKTGGSSRVIYLKVYEQNSDGSDKETPVEAGSDSWSGANEIHSLQVTGLNTSKVYKVVATNDGTGNSDFYEMAFTTPSGPSVSGFSPVSGSEVGASQTITITGSTGSTIYYKWATSAQTADAIYNSGSGEHGTEDAASATTTVESGKTLYAIARKGTTNSTVAYATYTIDVTAPTLSSSTPANNATNIATSGNIVLTFSENVSINDASKFTLSGGTLNTAGATVSGAAVTIPYSGLTEGTEYTFSATAGAVKDAAGNTSAALSDIVFTTGRCAVTSCGNASLTYAINASTDVTNTAANLLIAASTVASNTTALGINTTAALSTIGISSSDNKGKAAAATNSCFAEKQTMSSKIGMYNGSSYSSTNYLQFSFTVKAGYTFTPCDIQFVVQPVSNAGYFRWEVTDGTTSYGYGTGSAPVGAGNGATVLTGLTSTSEMTDGTYYIRLYPYYNGSNTFRISNDVILRGTTAAATPPTGYAITKSATNGSITTSVSSAAVTTAEENAQVDIVATPNIGYEFTSWDIYKTGESTTKVTPAASTASTYFTMPAYAVTVGATFTAIDYTITKNSADHGTYTVKVGESEVSTANYGQTVTLAATPESGYVLSGWTVMNGETPVSVTSNQFTMPAGNVTVNATFVEAPTPCFSFVPKVVTENESITVGDELTVVTGGTMVASAGTYTYEPTGLLVAGNSSSYLTVTLPNLIAIGTKINVELYFAANTTNRGLKLCSVSSTSDIAGGNLSATFSEAGIKNLSYTVKTGDGIIGTNVFRLYRNNNIYVKSISVTDCGAEILDLGSAVDPTGKGTVTLSATKVASGATATATYSAIDAAYEFDEWQISGTGATIDDAKANPVTITMGSTDATITLKLKAAAVKHTVTYYDGEAIPANKLDDELIVEGNHPTGAGLAPRKLGYTFAGWSTSNGGAVVALNTISVDADMPLYAVWNAINCATKTGTIYTMSIAVAPAANCTIKTASGYSATWDLYQYEGVSGGEAMIGNTGSSNNCILQTNKTVLLKDNTSYMKLDFDCPLKEGDTIKTNVTGSGKAAYISTADTRPEESAALAIISNSTTGKLVVPAALNNATSVYLWKGGGNVTITSIEIVRPVKHTVSFNMNGHGDAIDPEYVVDGAKATEPDPAPTASGYRFVEWQLSGSAYDFDDAVTTDIELDAVWQKTWKVTFDADNGSDPVVVTVDNNQAVAQPANPEKSGFDFVEWQLSGSAYNFATSVTGDITLTATWEVAQTDASLSALSYDGNAIDVASAEDVSGVQTYTYHLPWGSTVDDDLISVTKSAETATVSEISYDSENLKATFSVESGNHTVTINYAIQFVIDPKRGTSIIKATTNNVVTGLIGGTIDQSYSGNANSRKLNKNNYFGVTLANDETFQEGDVFIVNITTPADLGKFMIYADKNRTELVADQGIVYTKPDVASPVVCPTGEMMLVLPAAANGKKSLYLSRENVDNSEQWNVTFSYIEVTREMAPAIKSFKFDDEAATINESAKTITYEVAYGTDVTALIPTVEAYGNNGATYTPAGATDFTSPVVYTVTDDYNELHTDYTVTVNIAAPSTNAYLASLSVAGYVLDFDKEVETYNIVLDYGTTVLPEITYAVEDAGLAEAVKAEGGVNGTTTITVTPQAGAGYKKVYTINFSVSTNPKYVIYDGSTMTNIASATGADGSTGFSYSLASNIPLSGDAISSSWGGKDYTYVIKGFKPNDNSSNIVSFVIPEGYVAKVRLVGSTNSDTKERKMFIAMSASKDAADAIDNYIITSSTYDAQGFVSDYLLPNTYYLGSTDAMRLFEFSVTLYPIDEERAMTQGRFGTICYPNGGYLVGAMLLEIAYFDPDQKKIFFDEVIGGQMVAGAPYLFLPNEGVDKFAITYTDALNAAAGHHNGLYGSYTQEALPTDGNHYIMLNNQYCKVVEANTYVGANRAYIKLDKIGNDYVAPSYGRRRVSLGVQQAEVATGLEDLNLGDQPIKIMINGQMYILRGEKMYDATGRLVK